ncbi:IclR family transcriptional regulator [Actinomycetospora sp. OC33-EN08]|uniref:IclR family transcriptional regulator n=1 Tax=Actinomycetospora aurantiaca TaxID=3129233 RepID=A0ABU8MGN4_9PSEU
MDERTGGTAVEPVRVLVKAMAVLDLLAESSEQMTLGDIAARLELNKSTCYRILSTLATEDFVERPSPGSYRLGVGAFRIGAAMARRMGVRERALPAMQDLYRATGETVFLLVPHGDEAVCVERLDGRYAATHTLRVGGVLPLHLGAGPRLLLASLPDEQREAYFAGGFARRVVPGLREDGLRAQIERIREDGYSFSEDDVETGVSALSAPVRDHTGSVVAALSLSGLSAHLPPTEREEQVNALFGAAGAASRALGHRGEAA